MADAPLPLEGVRVIDIATVIAGPGVAARLGDFGADVIKIEHPEGGDTTRDLGWTVRGKALWWKQIGRNKRPVTLDLSRPEGRDVLLRLVETADALVESFRPGTLERWGLAPQRLHERNPRLVVCRVSGFGQTGPHRERPAFGTTAESVTGYAHMAGEPGRRPLLPPIALSDELAGLLGAFGVLLALYHRDVRDGTGQVIDLSLTEGLFGILGPLAAAHHALGVAPGPMGSRIPYTGLRNTYRAADGGWIGISGTGHARALRVFDAIGRPELREDPRFATNEARIEHADALDDLIQAWVGARTRDEALAAMEEAGAAAAPVLDVAEALADPQVLARETFLRVPDPDLDEVTLPAPQPRLSGTPGRIRHPGLPLGAATDQVLAELGFPEEDLTRLRGDGII